MNRIRQINRIIYLFRKKRASVLLMDSLFIGCLTLVEQSDFKRVKPYYLIIITQEVIRFKGVWMGYSLLRLNSQRHSSVL